MDNLPNGEAQTVNAQMDCTAGSIPFKGLPYFSKIIIDYIEEADELKTFYDYPVSFTGIEAALLKRKTVNTDRETLVTALKSQYGHLLYHPSNKIN